MSKQYRIMYIWGTQVSLSYDLYTWIMRGETREIRFRRAIKVLIKRRKESRYV